MLYNSMQHRVFVGFRGAVVVDNFTTGIASEHTWNRRVEQARMPARTQQALDDMWHWYAKGPGLMLKVVECSLVPPWMWLHSNSSIPADARLLDEQRCLLNEMGWTSEQPPGSLLRWDLPDALFRGGRWTMAARREYFAFGQQKSFDACGCGGHQISSTAIGLLLHPSVIERVSGAFAQDAAAMNLKSRPKCATDSSASSLEAHALSYAALRRHAVETSKTPMRTSPRLRCKHASAASAAAHARAYARQEGRMEGRQVHGKVGQETSHSSKHRCHGTGSFYNQMHTSFGPSDIAAVFYVNDTLTPTLLPKGTAHEIHQLVEAAKCAASRAHGLALRAAQMIPQLCADVRRPPPQVVQYRFTDECFASHSYLNRSSQPSTERRPSNWIIAAPPPTAHATCDPRMDAEVLQDINRRMRLSMASGRPMTCDCMMPLAPEKVLQQHTLHLLRAEEAAKKEGLLTRFGSTANQFLTRFHRRSYRQHAPLLMRDKDFIGVSQNFCETPSGRYGHCLQVRNLTSDIVPQASTITAILRATSTIHSTPPKGGKI